MSATVAVPTSITTPDTVESSRLGTLEFNDGAPTPDTAERLYDHLDFVRGVDAYLNSLQGASLVAVRRGFQSVGVEDNQVLIFPELMDSASLFLTANSDTVYFWTFIDLTPGPMVLDVPVMPAPSAILGTVDDMWFRWVTDVGLPGPDRGEGGKYLLVGPGYDGPLPDSGFHVSHVRTTRATMIGRAFMIDNDPAPAVEAVKAGFRIYPYTPGATGTAVGSFLAGRAPLAGAAETPQTTFVDAVHLEINTVTPNDFSFWEAIDELVQQEPAGAGDPEILGQLAAVGIRKGQPFAPDERMRAILEEAVAVGNATARTLSIAPRESEGMAYYPGSAWFNMLFVGGYQFLDPPPELTAEGVRQSPSDGARKLNSRIVFFYPATGVTPAMCMRLTGIGSQYLMATRDSNGEFLDGARQYRLNLPADIPESRFWSVMVYDRQTRSMLQTEQPQPSLGSQSGTVEQNADGSTDLYIGPEAPAGREHNWIQTVPGKGWFLILRLYSPLQPFFDKTWRPSELEPDEPGSNGQI
jgi:hypothetical protein